MLNKTNRPVLEAILDELIPPSEDGKIPGAGAVGVADFLPAAHADVLDPIASVQTILNAVSNDFLVMTREEKIADLQSVEAAHSIAF